MNCFVNSTDQLSETYNFEAKTPHICCAVWYMGLLSWLIQTVLCWWFGVFCAGSSGTTSLNYVGLHQISRYQGIHTFLKTLRPELKEWHFAEIFKCILLKNVCILYKILLKFDSEGPMDNTYAVLLTWLIFNRLPGANLLRVFNFKPNMDKESHWL